MVALAKSIIMVGVCGIWLISVGVGCWALWRNTTATRHEPRRWRVFDGGVIASHRRMGQGGWRGAIRARPAGRVLQKRSEADSCLLNQEISRANCVVKPCAL